MARIFITGSTDGLGQTAARLLLSTGHRVVVHARNASRALDVLPGADAVVTGDLSSIKETIALAAAVNRLGAFDAVIHNAGVYLTSGRSGTVDGLPTVFAVNSLAPYILTCLIDRPARLVYLSSGLHKNGDPSMEDLTWEKRRWSASGAYADSKLHDVLLAFAVARRWPGVYANAVDPGWVATKMGGTGAPDSREQGADTPVWLATSDNALVSGQYFYHRHARTPHTSTALVPVQEDFLLACQRLSGVAFPTGGV
ncbi:SDR family NAD(P)-dependent oxidoreductase [Dinghuibacter silviterrae]|uniref:NAD(P)-dependent dehydrogenase (Short-subunit alcohol dehydrogenase family) n=1 Tax=Dinghuibacter silviterrae TaxID=1539049 RepID=A0A4R8DGG3_9BACT|nr:SDR family NAD(P)-dependent oxidoreductase [Dinghuibacter silviterrae]TDW96733.1 NAD(P)-dependent dehydrogenase (short-subunit alcohol dehydrogenase family) [Dinghuibacter silviterrae]